MKTIKIATEFSPTPAGRYPSDGPSNGETFRERFLREALAGDGSVTVDLDGAAGYPSSFIEEAFGGLVRKGYASADALKLKLFIRVSEPDLKRYERAIWHHIKKAKPE